MNRSFIALAVGIFAVASSLTLAGCRSDQRAGMEQAGQDEQAVLCAKCETTWVRRPERSGPHDVTVYRTKKSMQCPDCETAVQDFFWTGTLSHSCKTCGDALQHCMVQPG